MKLVIQRVKSARVDVGSKVVGQIQKGLLIFLGVAKADTLSCVHELVKKIVELRIFEDSAGKMNLSSQDVGAQFLIVSQFTLYGNCKKGRRPSFDEAADPKEAEELYNYFVEQMRQTGSVVETGVFRAQMDVSLINDGPVTFIIDGDASDH